MAVWYCGSTKYTAVAQWAASTAYVIGDLVRQKTTPTNNNERVFRCTTAGTTGGTEPTWTLTKGSTTSDNTVVWTEVTGNSAYGWSAAAPHLKLFLNGSSSWAASGDTIYVSNNHAETVGSAAADVTYTMPVGTTAVTRVVCVNDGAAPPTALATTATVTNASSQNFSISTPPGSLYCYGISFIGTANSGANQILIGYGANLSNLTYEQCTFSVQGGNSGSSIYLGPSSGSSQSNTTLTLKSCTLTLSHASQVVFAGGGRAVLDGCSLTGTAPTVFLKGYGSGQITLRACNLSGLAGSSSVIAAVGTLNTIIDVTGIDCRLGASVSGVSGTIATNANTRLTLINCDSADTVYRHYRQDYAATEQHETTIVRTGGATDGTTTVSRKVVSTANSTIFAPYESLPIEFWNTNLSAQTITIPVLTDGVTLTDADAWIEVEYLGTSGNPLGVIVSGRVSDPIFGTPSNHATDSTSTWTTTGLSSPVKQKLVSPSFTAQKAGLIRVWVKVARSSTTVYYDPKALSTSARQYMSEAGVVNEGASSSGSGYSRGRVVNN